MAELQQCLSDNCYNITKQLAKKLEFMHHVDRYIEDAKKDGDSKAEETWRKIRDDEYKHSEMLRELLAKEIIQ